MLQPRIMTHQISSIHTSFVRILINTDRAAKKSAIYGIMETTFFEGKRANSAVGLNCMRKQFNFTPFDFS